MVGNTVTQLIPNKAGFRLFITRFAASVNVAAAQVAALVNNGLSVIYWQFSGNVLAQNSFEFNKGFPVVDGEGVSISVGAAGPGISAIVEGYYEVISPGT